MSDSSHQTLQALVEQLDAALERDGSIAPGQTGPAQQVLDELVRYNTTSTNDPNTCQSNVALAEALKHCFDAMKIPPEDIRYSDEDRHPPGSNIKQATLVVRIMPSDRKKFTGGVLLSGHTDVVAAAPEAFHLREEPGDTPGDDNIKLFGRGTSDMKMGIVNMLATAGLYQGKAQRGLLEKPIYLAFSWGEEVGCKGTPTVIRLLKELQATPDLAIVGEPTNGALIIGHKGARNIGINLTANAQDINPPPAGGHRREMRIDISTHGGHSSTPEDFVDATVYAKRLYERINAQAEGVLQQMRASHPDAEITVRWTSLDTGPGPNSIASSASLGLCVDVQKKGADNITIERIADDAEKRIKDICETVQQEAVASELTTYGRSYEPGAAKIELNTPEYLQPGLRDHKSHIEYAFRLFDRLATLQKDYIRKAADNGYMPPYPVINLGKIAIGPAATEARFGVHIRPTTDTESETITGEINNQATALADTGENIRYDGELSITHPLPNQSKQHSDMIQKLSKGVADYSEDHQEPKQDLVSYATEAGGLATGLHAPDGQATAAVIYGPGDIIRAHTSAEHITVGELRHSLQFPLMAIRKICIGDEKLQGVPSSVMIPAALAEEIARPHQRGA